MPKDIKANDSVTVIPLIGPTKASLLEKLGIETVRDLLFHIPFRYRDTSDIIPITQLQEDMEGTILGKVDSIKNSYTRNRLVITKAKVSDESGGIDIVWFNQPYLTNAIEISETYLFEGKISPKNKSLTSPSYEKFSGDLGNQTHLGKITPFYPETKGITSKWLRSRIGFLLGDKYLSDPLPDDLLNEEKLTDLNTSIKIVHSPTSEEEIERARKRLAFDEMLKIAFDMEKAKRKEKGKKGYPIEFKKEELEKFIRSLPFRLTKDQEVAINEMAEDLSNSNPMKRLLNGDVGSGKTVVAAALIYLSYVQGYSSLVMAPTSILAQQHFKTFKDFLKPFKIPVSLRVGGKKLSVKNKASLIVGTHALLFEQNLPENVALTIVDEQHRFGVKQRKKVSATPTSIHPHYLSMTATPIPRTLTNVLFGDTDVSFLRDMPKGRLPVKTYYVPIKKRNESYKWIKDKIEASDLNEQAFVIFPLVEESEKVEAKAATKEFKELTKSVLKGLKVGLIHGQLKEKEKNKILRDFKDKKYSVLIATSVVEVGIDIPDATMMIIENSERFGLAQLHQFRGRVGRSDMQSYCFVLAGEIAEEKEKTIDRLKYFSKHSSGFDVAEYDLNRRGPGEVYGLKQSGLPNLKVASISDIKLLLNCRKHAQKLLNSGKIDMLVENLFR